MMKPEYDLATMSSQKNPYAASYEGLQMRGLKDHEIALLVNDITKEISGRWKLPQMLRQVISGAVIDSLEKQNLRIDGRERICLDCGLRRGGNNVTPDF